MHLFSPYVRALRIFFCKRFSELLNLFDVTVYERAQVGFLNLVLAPEQQQQRVAQYGNGHRDYYFSILDSPDPLTDYALRRGFNLSQTLFVHFDVLIYFSQHI